MFYILGRIGPRADESRIGATGVINPRFGWMEESPTRRARYGVLFADSPRTRRAIWSLFIRDLYQCSPTFGNEIDHPGSYIVAIIVDA